MLIHFLISLSFSVQRFCLCQPDRLADSCSLEKKCRKYLSQSDIIIYNSQTNFGKSLFSNLNSSKINIKSTQDITSTNFDYLLFEVFGSQSGNKNNNPITINMLDDMFSDITKLTLYGGELNQVVHIQNMNSLKISFEAQNIQVIFDNENQVSFNKLSLRNSLLKFENTSTKSQKSKLTINANEVIGDKISLSSDYFALIKTGKLQVTDETEKDSNNFGVTAPVKIVDFAQQKNFLDNPKKKILEDVSSEPVNRFEYYYCVSTQSRLARTKELQDCEAYSVPIKNYYSSRDNEFLDKLSHVPSNTTLRLYITLSTESDPLRINFPIFINNNITVSIISANVDSETRIEIKGRTNSSEPLETRNITLSVSKIDYFLVDSSYLQSFNYVELYQSPIYISDPRENTTLTNLITDGTSISRFTGTDILVEKTLQLSRATPTSLQGRVILAENCTVEVAQYAYFPITRYNYENDYFYLTLSDSIEDQRLNLYFKHRIVMNYTERAAAFASPTLTFASGKTIENLDQRNKFPYINFTISVPPIGITVNYGTGSFTELPFPKNSVFTYNAPTTSTDLNLTINDFTQIYNENISDMFVLALVGSFRLNVMTPDTILPYLLGINQRYNDESCYELYQCTNETLPSFVSKGRCYHIGGYNLSLVNLDVQNKLQSVTYKETAVLVGMGSPSSNKFPKIAELIELTTSTSGNITFEISNENTQIDNITEIRINLKGTPTLKFDKSYGSSYKNDGNIYYENLGAMQKLTIDHDLNDVLMIGETIPVPPIQILDPIQGVLFESDKEFPYPIINQTLLDDANTNTRYGSVIEVNVNSDIKYPEEAFLAENITFSGNSQKLQFQYYNSSRCKYTFKNLIIDFYNEDKKVDFRGKYLRLDQAQIIQNVKNVPLTISVDELRINTINSIPVASVSAPVIANKTLIIDLPSNSKSKLLAGDDIKQIIFGEDSVTLVDQSGQQSAKFETADPNAGITINTNQEQEILLSVEEGAESVPPNAQINFDGKSANLNYDKSWSNVAIPSTFATNFGENTKNVHLTTEMMSLPPVKANGIKGKSIETTTHKRKLTKDLAFWIFIGITGLIFVIALILCIVGLTCCRHVEELDISSSAEGDSDFAIGEIDGLPPTQAEVMQREIGKGKIKEERLRAIEERKRKKEERKKKIEEGKLSEEEDLEEEDSYEIEENYRKDDEDNMYHNRSEMALQPKPQKKQKKSKKKKTSETSEEFKLAKKKAQLNTASGVASPPPAPPAAHPTSNLKPPESDHDAESASYNQSDQELSSVSISD